MIKLDTRESWNAVRNYECPNCSKEPFYTEDKNVIKVNENLMYSYCSNCKSYYKFKRRAIKYFSDAGDWEYTLEDKIGKRYGVRGYIIKPETYNKFYTQYMNLKNYFRFGLNEIDDLFKDILGQDREGIYDLVSPAFNDDNHYKKYKNWHDNIDDFLTNDRLLNGIYGPIVERERTDNIPNLTVS